MIGVVGAMQEYDIYGRHYTLDCLGVDRCILDNEEYLSEKLKEAAEKCGATVRNTASEQFKPNGVTVAHILSESHITAHTYPERGFIAIDCYTCGTNADPKIAIDYLIEQLKPAKYVVKFLERGVF